MSGHGERETERIGGELTTGASRRNFLKGTGALAVTGTLGAGEVTAHGEYGNRVVGYYPSYAGDYTPADIPFDKLTHLNYAFLDVQSDGTVSVGSSADENLLSELTTYDDTDTVFLLSISSGWYSGTFSDAASTAAR
jgi:chitinase